MIKLRFSPEYNCSPIWQPSYGYSENIDPRSLPISNSLLQSIIEWDNDFQKCFDFDLNNKEFYKQEDSELEDAKDKIAYMIYLNLCEELGEKYEVEFYFYVSNSKKIQWGL